MQTSAVRVARLASSVAIAALTAVATPLAAQNGPVTHARLIDADGDEVGTATLQQTPNAGVLIRLELTDGAPGTHALHVHETGRCDPPDFESAGDHYAPRDRRHGFLDPGGPHAGDLPNIHVPANGELVVEHLAHDVTLERGAPGTLHDDDGSALVIHVDADDYRSQPSGDSGDRIVCGVIR